VDAALASEESHVTTPVGGHRRALHISTPTEHGVFRGSAEP
jgi:hypothetical protein